MMGFLHTRSKMMVIVFALLFTAGSADQADELCPSADMTSGMEDVELVNSYLSFDGAINVLPLCGMQYRVPVKATLYQGMLAASQQQGSNFMFTVGYVDPNYGHDKTSINNNFPDGSFSLRLYENTTRMYSQVGVDFIDLTSESGYLLQYTSTCRSNSHDSIYTGPCGGSSVIAPTMPLMYKVAFLTISNENTNNDFKPVCKRPILIKSTGTTVFSLFQDANSQLPIYVQAVLDMQMNTVTKINGLTNANSRKWTGNYAGSNDMIPDDLAMTTVEDGDHFVFRFAEASVVAKDPSGNVGAPSAGQLSILLYAVMLLATLMPSM